MEKVESLAKVMDNSEAVVINNVTPIILWVSNLSKILPAIGIKIIIETIVGMNRAAAVLLAIPKYWLKIVTWKKWSAVTNEDIEKNENASI